MRPLTPADIRPPVAYEPVRVEARRRLIEIKRDRRVPLGHEMTLVFENRETVRGVIEELLRAERIEDAQCIAEEVAIFNDLVPRDGELAATLFLEITDAAELGRRLSELGGIESAVRLEIGGEAVKTIGEAGRTRNDRTSSVHYLRFVLSETQRAAFLSGGPDVELAVEHPSYVARSRLSDRQRLALSEDLLGG